jgi:hypothetical protein
VPAEIGSILEAWAGCVAGAIPIDEMRDQMAHSGLKAITLRPKSHYVDALSAASDPLYAKVTALLPEGENAADFITSVDIQATKPDGCGCSDGCCSD